MFCDGAERGYRQEQQGADDRDSSSQQASERESIVAQCTQAERRGLFHSKETGHGDRRQNRQEAAEHNDDSRRYVPWNSFGRRVWIVIQSIGDSQAIERRAVVG